MKVLILGATGGTGRLIVEQAIAADHEVVALVRDKAKAGRLTGAGLVQGDARSAEAVAAALVGCDAVVSALGTGASPFKQVSLLSTATGVLVAQMERQGVPRLVCITGLGAGDSRGHGGFLFDHVIMPLLLRNVYADKDRQEAVVRRSSLDWTLVRPMVLTDNPATNKVEALTDLATVHGGTIPRADVARFIVRELRERRWSRQAPLIRARNSE
jgi:putative NADH-flavin reductase